jgi:hypothetical protein
MAYERLTLHVGMPKTGTTTIQSFLATNRKRLQDHGLFSLGPFCLKSYPSTSEFFDEERLRCGLDEIKRRTKKGINRLLWSHEGFSNFSYSKDGKLPKIIQRGLPASSYRVIIYLRRQDHFLRSAYLEWGIVGKRYPGRVVGFDDWLHGALGDDYQNLLVGNADYAGLIQPWSDVFGSENIVVRVFEKGQMLNGDLLQDFCNAAEVPTDGCVTDIPNKNVSYNMELYDMLGMYKSVLGDGAGPGKMAAFVRQSGEDEFFTSPSFARFAIPPKRRIEILQRCDESNRKVAKTLLGREDGVLFRESWPSSDEPYQAYDGLTTEKLVSIFLHILQKQDEKIKELERLRPLFLPLNAMQHVWRKAKNVLGSLRHGTLPLPTSANQGTIRKQAEAPS